MGLGTQGSSPRPPMTPLARHGVPACLNASQTLCLGRGARGGHARLWAMSLVPSVQNLLRSCSTWYCGNELLGQNQFYWERLVWDSSVVHQDFFFFKFPIGSVGW